MNLPGLLGLGEDPLVGKIDPSLHRLGHPAGEGVV